MSYEPRMQYERDRDLLVKSLQDLGDRYGMNKFSITKAIELPVDHYEILINYRGTGLSLEIIHGLINKLELYILNDDTHLDAKRFIMKYNFRPVLLCDVGSLRLSTRAYNSLDLVRIGGEQLFDPMALHPYHIGKLLKLSRNDLLNTTGIGNKICEEIIEKLKLYGLKLRDDEEGVNMAEHFPTDEEELLRLQVAITRKIWDIRHKDFHAYSHLKGYQE